jgi:hypothetical protein
MTQVTLNQVSRSARLLWRNAVIPASERFLSGDVLNTGTMIIISSIHTLLLRTYVAAEVRLARLI